MTDKIFDVTVQAYDPTTMFAILIDQREMDDVVKYEMFAPAQFSDIRDAPPKKGETLRIRYGRMGRGGFDKGIIECWRPNTSTTP